MVKIPRPDASNPNRRADYHDLLLTRVFPLADSLIEGGLAEGYDFLSHSALDLRLWLIDAVDLEAVRKLLRKHDLPDQLEDHPPAETGIERTRLLQVPQRGAEQVRSVLQDDTHARGPEEVLHWFLNQYGLHNQDEVRKEHCQLLAAKVVRGRSRRLAAERGCIQVRVM